MRLIGQCSSCFDIYDNCRHVLNVCTGPNDSNLYISFSRNSEVFASKFLEIQKDMFHQSHMPSRICRTIIFKFPIMYSHLFMIRDEETFFHNFLIILKHPLQNYQKILKIWFFCNTYLIQIFSRIILYYLFRKG